MDGIDTVSDALLMCKDLSVYNITKGEVLNKDLLPGAMLRETLGYFEWMKTRYSAGTNASARRLMLRAFGTDNHNRTLGVTRALSLSDCYWLKQEHEKTSFDDVTPYLHDEWQGEGVFEGGSISTLFANGASSKRWIDSTTLLKEDSFKEIEPYELCKALDLEHYASKARISDKGIKLSNFTSMSSFLESFEQSGFVGEMDDARTVAVSLYGDQAVALFVIDYLVEHDDRHWGNIGFIRDADSGSYISMAPYYDFDWVWTDSVVNLPSNALENHNEYIASLCEKAKTVASRFEHGATITKRANELIGNIRRK